MTDPIHVRLYNIFILEVHVHVHTCTSVYLYRKYKHVFSGNMRSLAVVSFNQPGTFMLTGADDGHVFVVDARCTENFKCLGFVGEFS